jgi:hypothetical protein
MTPARPEPRTGFSAELRDLAGRFDGRPARLADVLAATRGRGYHLLLLVIALPFVGPVPLPGFSIPFGAAVAVIGLRLALHREPWLPARLLQRELPPHFLARTLRGVSHVVRGLEALARPRWPWLSEREFCQRVSGGLMCVSGLFLMLPLPLPLSNSLPAWTVILLSAGAIARDGLLLVAGGLAFGVSVAFFTLVAAGGRYALERLLPWFAAG